VVRLAVAGGLALALAVTGCSSLGAAAGSEPPGTGQPVAASGTPGPDRPSASGQATSQPARPPARPLAGKVVVIDPGHNGGNWAHPSIINRLVNVITEWKPCDTTGAQTGAGYTEHAFSFNVAIRLARLLRARGARVITTRTSDHGVGPCITERAAIGNRAHADAAISIHADGGPPSGYGFDVIEPGRIPGRGGKIIAPSRRLGLDIRDAYHRITGEPYATYVGRDAIDVRTDLGGLNLSTVPKVFIECANMRNAADAARLASPAFRQRIARALAAGFTAFLANGRA
jgi:N-acetylmuramoyl-L-alanine amidase